MYRNGRRDDVLPAQLDFNSGLLKYATQDDGAVEIEALGQSRVVPGMQITVLDEFNIIVGGGPLRVERVSFSGSNHTNFLMSIEARTLEVLA